MTREEAIRHIRDVIAENNSIKPNIVTFEQEKEALYMAIEALSAEAVQGEWKIDEYGIYRCPFCQAINNTVYKSFCPNCGAKMKGAKNEILCRK